jgi:replicative DNA helicase
MATRLNKIVSDPSGPGMVPPHNLEAEESVLGACLLSRQAIATALETLVPEDFYKPAHAEMFRIMLDLYARGEPLDAVTLGEELKRKGNLDEFGGKPYLFTLVSSVPTPGSVGHYARIVQENATLRRLIEASQEIRDLAFALPEDVEQAVDQSEDLIYQVTNRRVSEDLAALKDLLTENMELVEKLYERGSAITGVATGFTDLDELTAGLQPSNLIIVAARPSMGKALALDTPIATPTGWTRMGELEAGSRVFDERGRPCRVSHISPVYVDHECYEVVFDDGSVLVADAGHQWFTTCPRMCAPRVVTTAQMLAEGLTMTVAGLVQRRWYMRAAEALELPAAGLPMDPYVLGCCLAYSDASIPLTLCDEDRTQIAAEFEMAGAPIGLLTESRTKLPIGYLRASFKQRLALLQGFMDIAGRVSDDAGVTVELHLANRGLMEQVHHLACSLGHKPGSVRGWAELRHGAEPEQGWLLRWRPADPVFRLARKANALATVPQGVGSVTARRCVIDIREVEPVPVRCIQVDSESHLYLAGRSLIPTHNSALALSIAQHVATNDHVPVVYFSLEMSKMELVQRLMCSEARVDSNRLRKGALQDSDWPKLSLALGRLAEAPIFIDDTPNATIMEMRAKCRRVASKTGLGMVIIDYLQLMAPLKRTDNRVQEVSEISRSLKILARELNVPVIALSQLSRNVEYRADKRPLLADLRESGSIEQDADVVMFIYRDEVYHPDSPQRGIAELHISKHRSGPIGKVELTFLEHYTKFANLARGM